MNRQRLFAICFALVVALTGFTIGFAIEAIPRIKIAPSFALRGATIDVSLRGYAAGTTVRVRWKKGISWIDVAQVTTSSTGSANITVNVPMWAPEGSNSVRGDAITSGGGRAQTNGLVVSAGIQAADVGKPGQ